MSNSRAQILARLAANKPAALPLPQLPHTSAVTTDLIEIFTEVAVNIGSQVFQVQDWDEIKAKLKEIYPGATTCYAVPKDAEFFLPPPADNPHALANTDLALLQGQFAVAENSAIWLTEEQMGQRVLPFICQHLALVIRQKNIVENMHQAYLRLGSPDLGYGTFIAGPSKTADIEQSLVLGAHGPRSLSVFILMDSLSKG